LIYKLNKQCKHNKEIYRTPEYRWCYIFCSYIFYNVHQTNCSDWFGSWK